VLLPTISHSFASRTPECLVPIITHSTWQQHLFAVRSRRAGLCLWVRHPVASEQSHHILYLLPSLCVARIVDTHWVGEDVDKGVVHDVQPRHGGQEDLGSAGSALPTLGTGSCAAGWLVLLQNRLNGVHVSLHICRVRRAPGVYGRNQTSRDVVTVLQLSLLTLELETDGTRSHDGGWEVSTP
jgi:hypothetical protein